LAEDTVWQMHERTNGRMDGRTDAQREMKSQLAALCPITKWDNVI